MSKAPEVPADDGTEVPKKSRKKLVVILLATVLLLGAGGGGAYWWSGRSSGPAKPAQEKKLPMQYFAMEPSFVVNLADTDAVRYLQADLQLATRDPETLAAMQAHAPALRNRLLLLFGQQTSGQLVQRSGKERLQDAAQKEVKTVLKQEGAPDKVEGVIFTSLVTQ